MAELADQEKKILNTMDMVKQIAKDMIAIRDRAALANERWSSFSYAYTSEKDDNNPDMNTVEKVIMAKPFIAASSHSGTSPERFSNILGSMAAFRNEFMIAGNHEDNFIFGLD